MKARSGWVHRAAVLWACSYLAGCARPPIVIVPMGGVVSESSGNRFDRALDELSQRLVDNLRAPDEGPFKVAILDFTASGGRECGAGTRIAAGLTSRLFQSGRFQVIERQQLDRLLSEQKMSASDLYDPSSASKLGSLIGARALVLGTLNGAGNVYEIHGRMVNVETSDLLSTADTTVRRGEVDAEGSCG